jgi:hypothetical protein
MSEQWVEGIDFSQIFCSIGAESSEVRRCGWIKLAELRDT